MKIFFNTRIYTLFAYLSAHTDNHYREEGRKTGKPFTTFSIRTALLPRGEGMKKKDFFFDLRNNKNNNSNIKNKAKKVTRVVKEYDEREAK